MTTEYTNRLTIAVPEQHIGIANHLALIVGESSEDINTFKTASYQDANGNLYAVASAVSKQSVIDSQISGVLPTTPTRAIGIIDRDKAQAAMDLIGQTGGIMLILDVPAHDAMVQMGLTRVPMDETL